MSGCDVGAGAKTSAPASVPGSTRELRLLAAGALLPAQLPIESLARVMSALRTLLQRCEAEFMHRHNYGPKRARPKR